MRPDRLRTVSMVLVLLFVGAACSGGETRRGVNVRSVTTDVGLGAKEEAETLDDSGFAGFGPGRLGGVFIPPKFDVDLQELPPIDREDAFSCPEAGVFDFPEEGAPTAIARPPDEFTARWVAEGVAKSPSGAMAPFRFMRQRDVQNVVPFQGRQAAEDSFTFDVVEQWPDTSFAGGQQILTRWLVIPKSPPKRAGVQSALAEGIYLLYMHTTRTTADGPEVFEFNPSPPIEFLKFPVRQGDTIGRSESTPAGSVYAGSTGTDAATQTSLTLEGFVERRRHVDACGQKIDAWFVNASQTWRFGTTVETYNYDYGISPQFGGLIVSECYEVPLGDEPDRVCHDEEIPPALDKPGGVRENVVGTTDGCRPDAANYDECLEEERKEQQQEEAERRERLKRLADPEFRLEFRVGEVPPLPGSSP